MVEIKNIVFTNYKMGFFRCLICFVNYLLPLKLKYAPESFTALEDNQIQGLITLDKDSKSNNRFKITKIFLEENSFSIARQLINYVLERYRAQGASAFYAVVDLKQEELLNIFKNELNFRVCAKEYLFKINSLDNRYSLFLKPFKKEDVKNICSFYNESINSFNRFLFLRYEYQFFNKCQKYIFYNEDKSRVLGYFEVATKNNLDFYVNFSIDFAYNIYLTDALKYIFFKLKHKNKKFNLYVKIKDYFMNSKELITILKENKAELIGESQILAKDYYKEIKRDNLFKNAKIIFNDPTIA